MHFDKQVQFLGIGTDTMKFKEGGELFKVSFFDPDSNAPVTMNIMDTRDDLLTFLSGLKFGTMLHINFALVPKDNLYKLQLITAEPVGK